MTIRTRKDVIEGQEVTVTVYPAGMRRVHFNWKNEPITRTAKEPKETKEVNAELLPKHLLDLLKKAN